MHMYVLTKYRTHFSFAFGFTNLDITDQWRIPDFRQGIANPHREHRDTNLLKFSENCLKLKKIGPHGGGGVS